jgi:creatinine amidohydrolase
MENSRMFLEMSWPEIKKAIDEKKVLLFCAGAVEQHGPHLPTGVDNFLPMEVLNRVANIVGGVVAPCTNYGYKSLLRSGGGPHFVGSVSLRGSTVIALVKDIFSEFIRHGWRKFLVLDWHLENVTFVFEGIDEAVREAGDLPGLKVIKIDNIVGLAFDPQPENYQFIFGDDFRGMMVEHASAFETSAMLAARPDLVEMDKAVDGTFPQPLDYDILPAPLDGASATGVFWKATQGTVEKGERIMKVFTDVLVKVIEKEFPST